MENNLISLEYNGNPVRCIQIDGAPWWVLSDVCKVLGVINPRNVANRIDDDEKNTVHLADGIRGNPNCTIINESGLYNVLLRSDKPEAKPFKRWVTHEVLPQIRNTGKYEAPKKDSTPVPVNTRLVDIIKVSELTGVCKSTILTWAKKDPDFIPGEDYVILRGDALQKYKRNAGTPNRQLNALTVFTVSGLKKLEKYVRFTAPSTMIENRPPEAASFDEVMQLRYNRTTQAQILLHIADRTTDKGQREYLYSVVTDILIEEDIWKEGDSGYRGRSSDFDGHWVEGHNKRVYLETACALAKVGKPVTHESVIQEIHRPKAIPMGVKEVRA